MRYEGMIYRPPSEAYSLLLQVTIGCSHNKCRFCSMFKDKNFRVRGIEEIFRDIDECRMAYRYVDRVFLCDGDALCLATDKLLAILKRALAFEPDNRYENSYEMLKALWEYCGDEPEEIKPASKAPELPEEPKPQAEPKPEPKKQPRPEPKKTPAKEGEAKAAPVPKPQEPPKKDEAEPALPKQTRNIHEKRATKRSAVTLAVITLLLVGVGFGRSSISFDVTPPAVQTQAPEPTAQPTTPPSAAPTETPEPSKAPAEVQYMLYSEDVSWDEAERRCTELGGHLATIKDAADYEKLCQLLADSNAQYVWIGAYRGDDGQIKWLDGKEHDFYAWAQGEPSMTDSYDGAAENYIMLVKQADGTWLYNDSRPDPMAQYSRFYSGKIAYICQIG